MISRKNFLLLSSLGFFSVFIPNYLSSKSFNAFSDTVDVNLLLKQAADYRKKGKLAKAKDLYLQIISSNPQEIRAYDGIRKIMLARGKQEFEVIKMFRQALNNNPGNIEIRQRIHNEYLHAALGNQKVKNLIGLQGRLLLDVKQKYENILLKHPNKKNVQNQLEKINRLIDWNADNLNPQKNRNLKTYKKEQRKKFKSRFDNVTNDRIEQNLNKLLSKSVSEDRKPHIRELFHTSIKRLRKNKDYVGALDKAISFYNFDKNDSLSIKHIRQLAKYTNNFDKLISVEKENHAVKKNFWSATALFDSIFRKCEKTNTASNSDLENLLIFMSQMINEPAQIFETKIREIKLALLKKDFANTKDKLLNLIVSKSGINSPHTIDIINVLSAKYFKDNSDTVNFRKVLPIASDPNSFIDDDEVIIKNLAYMNINRSYDNPKHIENLQRLVNKLS